MSKRILTVGASVLGLLFLGQRMAWARDLSDHDYHMCMDAKLESDAELDLAGLAMDKTEHKEVKEVADHILDDQHRMNHELDDICRHYGVHLTHDDTISAEKMHQHLEHMSGHDFDIDWVNDQIRRHERMLDLYKDMAHSASEDDLRRYADDHRGVIEHHLGKLRELQDKLNH